MLNLLKIAKKLLNHGLGVWEIWVVRWLGVEKQKAKKHTKKLRTYLKNGPYVGRQQSSWAALGLTLQYG